MLLLLQWPRIKSPCSNNVKPKILNEPAANFFDFNQVFVVLLFQTLGILAFSLQFIECVCECVRLLLSHMACSVAVQTKAKKSNNVSKTLERTAHLKNTYLVIGQLMKVRLYDFPYFNWVFFFFFELASPSDQLISIHLSITFFASVFPLFFKQ